MNDFSTLVTRDLSGSGSKYLQTSDTLIWRNKGKNASITFPKNVGTKVRETKYTCMEYRVNELTREVFFVFSSQGTTKSMDISIASGDNKKMTRKLVVRSKTILEWLIQDLGITGTEGKLKLSDNISRSEEMLVFKVTTK